MYVYGIPPSASFAFGQKESVPMSAETSTWRGSGLHGGDLSKNPVMFTMAMVNPDFIASSGIWC